jgi:cation:H+ antiporter
MMMDEMAADGNEREDGSPDAEWRRERRMRPGVEREYQGDGFVVTWEPRLCIHASECFRNLPGVFRPWDRPWVRVEQGSAEDIEEEMEEREAFNQLTFMSLLRRIGITLRDPTPPLWLVLTQTIVAFGAIVLGARFFADFVEDFSHAMHFNTLLVALILAPLATELPEAANSLIWTRDSKDVIALGNVTGAMVFQSTFPVTIGVLLTPWQLGQFGTVAAVFALLSGLVIYIQLRLRARENALPLSSLMIGGSLYVVFIGYVLWSVLA